MPRGVRGHDYRLEARSHDQESDGDTSPAPATRGSRRGIKPQPGERIEETPKDDTPQPTEGPAEDQFGLFQLYPDPEIDEITKVKTDVDIIAIHGLGGHPMRSWESGGRIWLKDFLPSDLRTARIFTFGYNSGTAFTECKSESKSGIRDFATSLLWELGQIQRKTKLENRKVIFVCHSLGGIVLKQALIIANERKRYSAVGKSIAGVIFLGTPHRGSDFTFWGSTLKRIADLPAAQGVREDLLEILAPKSGELGEICSQFVERAATLQIFTIYERLKVEGLSDLVVDETSAILHLPNETPLPMEADHEGLVRYLTSSSKNYMMVRDCLTELFDSIVDEVGDSAKSLGPKQWKFVHHLSQMCPKQNFSPILHGHSRDSYWLFRSEAFRSWCDPYSQRIALWLHGPPGCGKTVLANQVANFLHHKSSQEKSANLVHKTLTFFFDDKDPKRRTNQALISSILLQLLADSKTAFVAKYINDDVYEKFTLDDDTLWSCLASIVQRSRGIVFFVVIDALDEMEREKGEIRQYVLNKLVQLAENDLSRHLRILITDRHRRPYQFRQMLHSEEMNVDNQATRKSIENFFADKVRSKLEAYHISYRIATYIEQELFEISKGNFLRATLTWRQFEQNLKDWSKESIRTQLEALHELPPGLDVFYFEILKSIPKPVQPEARKAFSIIMAAIEPLSLHQLAFLATSPGPKKENSALRFQSPDDFADFFKQHCAHFVKFDDNRVVSFAHQTIKELLLSKSDDSKRESVLSKFQRPSAEVHRFLLNRCLDVLSSESYYHHHLLSDLEPLAESLRGVTEPEPVVSSWLDRIGSTPCLRYATYHWISHYSAAAKDPRVDERVASFLELQSNYYYGQIWELSQILDPVVKRQMGEDLSTDPMAPLFHIILRGDFPAIVRILIQRQSNSVLSGANTSLSPLAWSIICKRKQSFMTILNSQRVNVNFLHLRSLGPIHHAVSCDDLFFLRALLNNDNVGINNVSGHYRESALHIAIRRRKYAAAHLLLDQPSLHILSKDHEGRTPYDAALANSEAENIAIKLLYIMEEREYLSISERNMNHLRVAGTLGWNRMLDILIAKSSTLAFAIDESGLCPLTWHAYYGEETRLRWILRHLPRDSITAQKNLGRYNLVSLCAHQGWQETTELLMNDYGLSPPDADHQGRNILHWAIFYAWKLDKKDVAKYNRNQLNQQDRDGSTPLHLAIMARNIDICKWLVARGASCVIKDRRGLTPVHLAADSGFRAAIQLFIETPHREFGKTREGASVLHYIATWFDSRTVDSFIVAKRPLLDCRDRKKRTPLHYAATADNASAVESLLKHGANIDERDQEGRTALHDALRSGGNDAGLVLIQHNADKTIMDNYLQSCLQISARYGQETLGELLLPSISRINAGDMFGMTALHRAFASGALSLVKTLLSNNADWTRTDKFSDSALDKAVIRGQALVVSYFLGWLQSDTVDEARKQHIINCALDYALIGEHAGIERMLVDAGAQQTGRRLKRWRPYVPEDEKSSYWPLVPGGFFMYRTNDFEQKADRRGR